MGFNSGFKGLIDNKLVVFWLNLLPEYLVKTHRDGTNLKKNLFYYIQ